MKYSTALTSWFVVFSISLIRVASWILKFEYNESRVALASILKVGISLISSFFARKKSQDISTKTRCFISAYSLKTDRKLSVLQA